MKVVRASTIITVLLVICAMLLFPMFMLSGFESMKVRNKESREAGIPLCYGPASVKAQPTHNIDDSHNACLLPSLLVVVLASTRYFPLRRALSSLRDARYDCAVVNLHVSVDAPRTTEMIAFARATFGLASKFNWPHGHKSVQQILKHRGLALSWLESLLPTQEEYVLILEDDMEVSRFYYTFFAAVVKTHVLDDPSIASMCLHPTWGLDPPVTHRMFTMNHWILIRYACSWGPIWKRPALASFKGWLSENFGRIKPYVPNEWEINKYVALQRDVQSPWTLRFLLEKNMNTLLHRISVDAESLNGTFLLLNHKEPGLHVRLKRRDFSDPSLLLTREDLIDAALQALPRTNGFLSNMVDSYAGAIVVKSQSFEDMGGNTAVLIAGVQAERHFNSPAQSRDGCWQDSSCNLDMRAVEETLLKFRAEGLIVARECLGLPSENLGDIRVLVHEHYEGTIADATVKGMGSAVSLAKEGIPILAVRASDAVCKSLQTKAVQLVVPGRVHCLSLAEAEGSTAILHKAIAKSLVRSDGLNAKFGRQPIESEKCQQSGHNSSCGHKPVSLLNIEMTTEEGVVLTRTLTLFEPFHPEFLFLRIHWNVAQNGITLFPDSAIAEIYRRGYVCTHTESHSELPHATKWKFHRSVSRKCGFTPQLMDPTLYLPPLGQRNGRTTTELLCFQPEHLVPLFTYSLPT